MKNESNENEAQQKMREEHEEKV